MIERHPRIATPAGIQGDAAIGKFNQPQIAIFILNQNHQNIGAVTLRISLNILT